MSIGLLLGLNFLTIPFLQEAEELGKLTGKFPNLVSIIYLKNTLKQRWFKLYCFFMAIFMAIAIAPTASGKSYPVGLGLVSIVLVVQVVLWVFVYLRVSKFRN
jgi:hypothetical protein